MSNRFLLGLLLTRPCLSSLAYGSPTTRKRLCRLPCSNQRMSKIQSSSRSNPAPSYVVTVPVYSSQAHRSILQRTVEKLDLSPVNPTAYDGSPDIADLPYLNEASVLHNLKTRYFKSSIYVRFHPETHKLRLFTFSETDLLRPLPRRSQSVSIPTHLHSSSHRKCVLTTRVRLGSDD